MNLPPDSLPRQIKFSNLFLSGLPHLQETAKTSNITNVRDLKNQKYLKRLMPLPALAPPAKSRAVVLSFLRKVLPESLTTFPGKDQRSAPAEAKKSPSLPDCADSHDQPAKVTRTPIKKISRLPFRQYAITKKFP